MLLTTSSLYISICCVCRPMPSLCKMNGKASRMCRTAAVERDIAHLQQLRDRRAAPLRQKSSPSSTRSACHAARQTCASASAPCQGTRWVDSDGDLAPMVYRPRAVAWQPIRRPNPRETLCAPAKPPNPLLVFVGRFDKLKTRHRTVHASHVGRASVWQSRKALPSRKVRPSTRQWRAPRRPEIRQWQGMKGPPLCVAPSCPTRCRAIASSNARSDRGAPFSSASQTW